MICNTLTSNSLNAKCLEILYLRSFTGLPKKIYYKASYLCWIVTLILQTGDILVHGNTIIFSRSLP